MSNKKEFRIDYLKLSETNATAHGPSSRPAQDLSPGRAAWEFHRRRTAPGDHPAGGDAADPPAGRRAGPASVSAGRAADRTDRGRADAGGLCPANLPTGGRRARCAGRCGRTADRASADRGQPHGRRLLRRRPARPLQAALSRREGQPLRRQLPDDPGRHSRFHPPRRSGRRASDGTAVGRAAAHPRPPARGPPPRPSPSPQANSDDQGSAQSSAGAARAGVDDPAADRGGLAGAGADRRTCHGTGKQRSDQECGGRRHRRSHYGSGGHQSGRGRGAIGRPAAAGAAAPRVRPGPPPRPGALAGACGLSGAAAEAPVAGDAPGGGKAASLLPEVFGTMKEAPRTQSEGDVNISAQRAAWQAAALDDRTRALLEEDARVFLHQSLSTPCLNALEHCDGIYLEDLQARRYMDFHGNSVHQVGFANPAVIAAVKAQLDELSFSPRRYTNQPAVALARKLAEIAPGDLSKVLFCPSGTGAIGIALKLARVVTGRHKVVSMWDAFHGASLDAISVGGEELFRRSTGPPLPGTEHVPPPDPYHCVWDCHTRGGCDLKCARYIED